MVTIQEQYTEIVKQSQEAVLTAVDAWAKTVQDAVGQLPAARVPAGAEQLVDQVFDFAGQLLATQRDFAKNLVHASASVAESARRTATGAAEAPADQE